MERHTIKKLLKYALITSIALIVIVYAAYKSKNLVAGPSITIATPENGQTFDRSVITVEGKTKNVVEISVNNRPIFVDDQGVFKEKYLLSPGQNTVGLLVKDKFGRMTQKTLELYYK
jgi:hypothetical protein